MLGFHRACRPGVRTILRRAPATRWRAYTVNRRSGSPTGPRLRSGPEQYLPGLGQDRPGPEQHRAGSASCRRGSGGSRWPFRQESRRPYSSESRPLHSSESRRRRSSESGRAPRSESEVVLDDVPRPPGRDGLKPALPEAWRVCVCVCARVRVRVRVRASVRVCVHARAYARARVCRWRTAETHISESDPSQPGLSQESVRSKAARSESVRSESVRSRLAFAGVPALFEFCHRQRRAWTLQETPIRRKGDFSDRRLYAHAPPPARPPENTQTRQGCACACESIVTKVTKYSNQDRAGVRLCVRVGALCMRVRVFASEGA